MGKTLIQNNKSNENNKTFLKLIYDARKNAGITQKKLADLLNKNQSYISKYENGDRRLDVVEFLEVAHGIGINAADLIAELDKVWKK